MSVIALPASASAHVCSSTQTPKTRVYARHGVYRVCLRGHAAYRLGLVKPDQTRVAGTQFAYTVRIKGDDFIAALDLADGTRWLPSRQVHIDVTDFKLRGIGALMWATDRGGVFVATAGENPGFHHLDGTYITSHGNVGKADQEDAPVTGLRITRRALDHDGCGTSYDIGFHWTVDGGDTSVHTELSRGPGCAQAAAATCADDQPTKVRIFQRGGAYFACLRGYPSHRLGLVRPDRRRVQGTMLAYTVRVKGDDFIAGLDLADGSRWLRGRPAGGLVVHMKLRRVGALIWTTDTGGVFVADLDETSRVDQLDAPATGLRITKRHTASDPCADEYAYTFHWRAGGVPRRFVWKELETYGCG